MDKDRKNRIAVGLMTVISIGTFIALLAVLGRWQVSGEGVRLNLRFRLKAK